MIMQAGVILELNRLRVDGIMNRPSDKLELGQRNACRSGLRTIKLRSSSGPL